MGTTLVEELKDGQIYRWQWRDPVRDADRGPYRSYHCKSTIAVVKNGLLIDTFWCDMSPDNAVRLEDVALTYLCDQSWPTISQWQIPYYASDDVVDTRHSNHSGAPIYLRPGAKRNADRIRQEIEYREERERSAIRSAENGLRWLAEARALLDAGKLDEVQL